MTRELSSQSQSLSHLPPGRRAAVDALTNERFGWPLWWKHREFVDSKLMQGIRRRALSEATEDNEETE